LLISFKKRYFERSNASFVPKKQGFILVKQLENRRKNGEYENNLEKSM